MTDTIILLALMAAIGPALWLVGELIEALGCGLRGWDDVEEEG